MGRAPRATNQPVLIGYCDGGKGNADKQRTVRISMGQRRNAALTHALRIREHSADQGAFAA